METREFTEERMRELEEQIKRRSLRDKARYVSKHGPSQRIPYNKLTGCSRCRIVKDPQEFAQGQRVCRTCQSAYHKIHYAGKGKLQAREGHLRRSYQLSSEQYDELVKKQNGKCAICKNLPSGRGKSGGKLNVDHDHLTGELRKLLCWHCNRLLGSAFDNPEILRNAVQYLEQHKIALPAEDAQRKGVI